MRTHRPSLSPLPLALAVAAALAAAAAHADSGIGVDTWRANKLDPTGGMAAQTPDPDGTSWLAPGQRRSPTGNLYDVPPAPAHPDEHGDWQYYGVLQLGYLGTGDDRYALWNRYAAWPSEDPILGLLDLEFLRPSDGSYAEVRASRISEEDQYYQAVYGKAGAYKVQAFVRNMPNILSTDARSIWNGVGTNNLTLANGLAPGASTSEEVAAASAAAPLRTLGVKREKQGIGYSMYLTPQWTAYFNATNEQRKGERPYGGPFFFAFAFPNDGGVNETVKPINDSTINVNGGLRYAGKEWRMDFSYSGSFYRDANRAYYFQSPFALNTPIIPGSVSAPLSQGQMSTEPDNDYHNLQATVTRKLPLNGEVSVSAAVGRMSQNDALIAPIDCQGVFGIGLNGSLQLGPQNPYLFPCSEWNTTAALSRQSADMRIDTNMFDARLVLQPSSAWTVRGGINYNRQDYRNVYTAYNPLNGLYGYVSENGSQGSIVPGEVGIIDPNNNSADPTRIRSLPLDIQTIDANLGADWRFSEKNTLGATLGYNRYNPTNRERTEINDASLKLTWVNRSIENLTLRANYTYLRQTGDDYDYDPYDYFYSTSLPGYVPPDDGTPAHTVSAMRKYDMSSRRENKVDLMATLALGDDMTLSGSVRGDWNTYDAEIGRSGYFTSSATLQWEWQVAAQTNVSAYVAWDRSRLNLSNVQDQGNGAGTDPTLGGSNYATFGQWWLGDAQRNYYGGVTLAHNIGRLRLDLNWNYLYSRGLDDYSYAGSSALAYPGSVAGTGPGSGGFPPMVYRVNSLTIGATMPINQRISLRLFDNYEIGRISDWHYLGFDDGLVAGNRVYTDAGPQSYRENLVGVLLNIKL